MDYSDPLESDPFKPNGPPSAPGEQGKGQVITRASEAFSGEAFSGNKTVYSKAGKKAGRPGGDEKHGNNRNLVSAGNAASFTDIADVDFSPVGLEEQFRALYLAQNQAGLKQLATLTFDSSATPAPVVQQAMMYLHAVFLAQPDSSFLRFMEKFPRLKKEAVLAKQLNRLRPLHLVREGQLRAALRASRHNLATEDDDSLAQAYDRYVLFQIHLDEMDDLPAARAVYEELDQVYPDFPVTQLAAVDLAVYEATAGPVLPKQNQKKTVETVSNLPKKFQLHQNYPNPFNPITTIKYDLPKSSRVKLEVFNILGQRVKVLVDERQEAGFHTIQWNSVNAHGSRVSSGLYIYRITAHAANGKSRFVKAVKMLLVR